MTCYKHAALPLSYAGMEPISGGCLSTPRQAFSFNRHKFGDPDGTRTHITRADNAVGNLCRHRAKTLERTTGLEPAMLAHIVGNDASYH